MRTEVSIKKRANHVTAKRYYNTNKHFNGLVILLLSLTDFYRGPVIEKVRLQGLEHVLQFTAVDDKIYLRSYRYEFACYGLPKAFAVNMGLTFQFVTL